MKKQILPFVLGASVVALCDTSYADVMWTYNSDIDESPHYLRINRIVETSPPDEEMRGFEVDGRYGLTDKIGLQFRHSWGKGDALEGGQSTDLAREIFDIGLSYGEPITDDLFYEVKAVYNYGRSSATSSSDTMKEEAHSIRITPRIRYDFNDYIQTRALLELEKPHNADLGSEAALYLTVIPAPDLALDIKFGKGITSTEHHEGKWADDQWYIEPRVHYRINEKISLEAAYRDKEEGGQIIDFGFVAHF